MEHIKEFWTDEAYSVMWWHNEDWSFAWVISKREIKRVPRKRKLIKIRRIWSRDWIEKEIEGFVYNTWDIKWLFSSIEWMIATINNAYVNDNIKSVDGGNINIDQLNDLAEEYIAGEKVFIDFKKQWKK